MGGGAGAGEITREQAQLVAVNFTLKDAVGLRVFPNHTVESVEQRGGLWLVRLKPAGHLFVSMNRSGEPIPSFSEYDFVEPQPGSPQEALLIRAEANSRKATGTKHDARWRALLGEKTVRLTASATTEDEAAYVEPLLKTSWSQEAPYYDFAPVNSGIHEPNGCVATAFGQIMCYWEWPEKVDADFFTEHTADSAWGFTQHLWAGTKLNWADMPLSGYTTEADRLNVGRGIMLCGMLAKMGYASSGSAAQNKDVTQNPWYTLPKGVDCTGQNVDELKLAVLESLNAKCPILVGIGSPNHSIVCDGYSRSGSTFYLHLNYGWGGMSTQDYALESVIDDAALSSFFYCQRPRPMVQVNALAVESTVPLTLSWAFPKKGYEDTLTGFTLHYAEVGLDTADWADDFSNSQGVADGASVAVEMLNCDNATPVLRFLSDANWAHYTWPAKFVTEDSALSFRVRSQASRGMAIYVQAYNPSTGWETIYTPQLADTETLAWQDVTIPLTKYANKAMGLRIEAQRVSLQGISGDHEIGVQFDDFQITHVRNILAEKGTIEVGKDVRAYTFTSNELVCDTDYVFTVEPNVDGGIASPMVSTRIEPAASDVAAITAITSVRKTGYQVQEGFYREGYLGLNQFGVYGSEATTGLAVRLSHPVLIDKSTPYFDTVDQKYSVTIGATSIVHAVSVEKVRDGKFLVKLDFARLTDYVKTTRLIVTFDALDAKGNIARKHFNLLLNSTGGEAAITAEQLPDLGGSAPETEPDTEPKSGDEPVLDPSSGNPNDFTEGSVNYRFCAGVDKTSGFFDVHRTGSYNTLPPISYNLISWWVGRYTAAFSSSPSDYAAPSESNMVTSDNGLTLASYTATLLDSTLPTTLPAGSERARYFPADNTQAATWFGTASDKAVQVGRYIFAALAQGPIGFKAHTSLSKFYCGVIWGCEYTADDTGKYATKLWVTDTRTKGDGVRALSFGNYSNAYGSLPGLKDFNGSGTYGLIEYYYPIVAPVSTGSAPDSEPKSEPETQTTDIGTADTKDDPGVMLSGYNYVMSDNYWTARKRAIAERKQLFILSGAYWCSNCSFVKDDLNDMGSTFSDKFVVYFSNHDSTTCVYFYGGLPQYGAADPRTVDAFTGTFVSGERLWSKAWKTTGNGIYAQERGHVLAYVQNVVNEGLQRQQLGAPTNLVVRGLPMLAADNPGKYELYAQFDDGVEMLVDHGVDWSVVSGSGTIVEEGVEGYDAGLLTVTSGTVKIKATSTFYFTGSAVLTVSCAPVTDITGITIETDEVNLEDDPTPTLSAVATLNNGQKLKVSGFGSWTAKFKSKIVRNDPDLEETGYYSGANSVITIDQAGTMTYQKNYERLEVCDQIVTVTLTANDITVSKEIKVWGPTKVAPSKWQLLSKPRITKYGVVRLACTELKYNYGGEIKRTTDTYFGSFYAKMKNGTKQITSSLRGLTLYSGYDTAMTWTLGLSAKKADGVFGFYSPDDPTASSSAQTIENVAEGKKLTSLAQGEMTEGFLAAYFPSATADMTDEQKVAFADEDTDGDGFKNWEEYVLGTDPADANDAFTLMQGYQHLTAPAGKGDTMQYKVMYQQRAGRKYYIDGKKNWGDSWTEVASVDLANAEEGDVTSFTYPTLGSAEFADGCKFFRVRAALSAHVFDYGDSGAPVIAPNMLVAAPNSVIDLSASNATSTAILDLASFDTDATDAGTVWVKVAADIAAGTTLIRAPKTARKSLEACRPKDSGEVAFVVVEENGRVALQVASPVPKIDGDNGEVIASGDRIVVTPKTGVTEVMLVNAGANKIEIPVSVTKIGGVTDYKKLIVKSGEHDVTPALKFTLENGSYAIALDEEAVVTVGNEEISVKPELANGQGETPFAIQDGQIVFKVKSIPGLKYKVLASDSLDPNGFTPAGEESAATSARRELSVTRPAGTQGFYKIQVSR